MLWNTKHSYSNGVKDLGSQSWSGKRKVDLRRRCAQQTDSLIDDKSYRRRAEESLGVCTKETWRKQQEGREDKEEERSCKDASIALRQRSLCSPRRCPMLSHPIYLPTLLPALLYFWLLNLPLVPAKMQFSHIFHSFYFCFCFVFLFYKDKTRV